MNQGRFQIGIPRVGSAARLSEEDERSKPTPRMSLPRAGSAARDAEGRKKVERDGALPAPVIGMRAQGGRRVTMEEMIAASKPAGSAGAPAGAAAIGTQSPSGVNAVGAQVNDGADISAVQRNTHATGTGISVSTSGNNFPVMSRPSAVPSANSEGTPASSETHTSVFPGPPRSSADRVKSLVRSLFSWNG